MSAQLTLRLATLDDTDLLLAWRNEPVTRTNSFNSTPISRADHALWLRRKLQQSEDCRFWIAEHRGASIGQARVDRVGPVTGRISVSLAAEARGRGLSTPLIEGATVRALEELRLTEVEALVKAANASSLRAFRSAGYMQTEIAEPSGESAVLLLFQRA